MKDVYTTTVSPYGTPFKESIAEVKAMFVNHAFTLRVCMSVILIISSLFNPIYLKAQNCPTTGTTVVSVVENTYYPGTQASVAAGATSVTLGPIGSGANFGNTPIAAGDIVLIIQMQGAQIFIPASTTLSTYGGNSSGVGAGMTATNLMAGRMEFAVASNAVPVGGGTLNLSAGLTYSYAYSAFGTNGQYTYQVIRVSTRYNIQLGANLSAPIWNGSTGGVLVLSAVNQFDFNGKTIDATGAGFRGGGGRALSGQTGLNKNDYYGLSTNAAHAGKGEGVAGTPRYLYYGGALVNTGVEGYPSGSYARGGPGNAGGGASDSDPDNNDQNAGGGGGGNGGAGGNGGNGWYSFGATGGKGGTAFRTYGPNTFYYSPGRLIMGGGGGAGTSNNATGTPSGGVASSGSSGGGIIIINANTIIGTGTVKSNGAAANATVTIDGSGGGGAGGSILIYAVSGHAGVTAIANGADGASNDPNSVGGATQHGPGGGGGGGVIYSNAALNAASTVTKGMSGLSIGPLATDNYGAANGFDGIIGTTATLASIPPKMQICQSIVLPVSVLSFNANYTAANTVDVKWTTTHEIDADYYEVQRSVNGAPFEPIGRVDASQSSDPIHAYIFNDQLYNVSSGTVYYQLRIVDKDGKFDFSKVVAVKIGEPEKAISVYPNPVDNHATLNLYTDKPVTGVIRLFDNAGKQIFNRPFSAGSGSNSISIDQLGNLARGIYIIQVVYDNNLFNQKLIKK